MNWPRQTTSSSAFELRLTHRPCAAVTGFTLRTASRM